MTKQQYTAYLNELYASYHLEQILKDFCYFNQGKIRSSTLTKAYYRQRIGSMLRRYDPIAFQVGYREHNQR